MAEITREGARDRAGEQEMFVDGLFRQIQEWIKLIKVDYHSYMMEFAVALVASFHHTFNSSKDIATPSEAFDLLLSFYPRIEQFVEVPEEQHYLLGLLLQKVTEEAASWAMREYLQKSDRVTHVFGTAYRAPKATEG